MIKSIDIKGKMFVSAIGGIDPYILLGQMVSVGSGNKVIRGVITHAEVLNNGNVPEKLKIGDLFVYTGMNKKELDKKGIGVGGYVSFGENCNFLSVGGEKDILIGKALDDRVGCYILLELIKNLKDRKSTRLNSSHSAKSRMPSSA